MKYQSSNHYVIGVLVSVLLQQRKEVQKVAEEIEALERLEQKAKAATSPIVRTDGAEVTEAKQVLFSIEVAHIVRAQMYWILILIFYTLS